jgi:hypothetical protein
MPARRLTSKELSLQPPSFDTLLLLSASPRAKSGLLRRASNLDMSTLMGGKSRLNVTHDMMTERGIYKAAAISDIHTR